ncbi:hypothetical protein NPIL_429221 [Nephila pilipes]|uniref:Uncharacterized protein n=1 Tax=Nephila pilipes TaxID=299642 RepID=A0A8X6QA52_NEPPI|nr:hypothetical protein NPIL_429221 [Nephila pilipes]
MNELFCAPNFRKKGSSPPAHLSMISRYYPMMDLMTTLGAELLILKMTFSINVKESSPWACLSEVEDSIEKYSPSLSPELRLIGSAFSIDLKPSYEPTPTFANGQFSQTDVPDLNLTITATKSAFFPETGPTGSHYCSISWPDTHGPLKLVKMEFNPSVGFACFKVGQYIGGQAWRGRQREEDRKPVSPTAISKSTPCQMKVDTIFEVIKTIPGQNVRLLSIAFSTLSRCYLSC